MDQLANEGTAHNEATPTPYWFNGIQQVNTKENFATYMNKSHDEQELIAAKHKFTYVDKAPTSSQPPITPTSLNIIQLTEVT